MSMPSGHTNTEHSVWESTEQLAAYPSQPPSVQTQQPKSSFVQRLALISVAGIFGLGGVLLATSRNDAKPMENPVEKPASAPIGESPAFGTTSTPSAEEIADYAAQIVLLADTEADLVSRWESVTGANYTSDAVLYETAVALLPDCQSYVARLESISPEKAQLAELHAAYVRAWNLQIEGLTMAVSALENQSYSEMAQANAKLSQARASMREYLTDIKALQA